LFTAKLTLKGRSETGPRTASIARIVFVSDSRASLFRSLALVLVVSRRRNPVRITDNIHVAAQRTNDFLLMFQSRLQWPFITSLPRQWHVSRKSRIFIPQLTAFRNAV